jgi:lipoprotein-anchoring transpeptidase ErfK/SrfK
MDWLRRGCVTSVVLWAAQGRAAPAPGSELTVADLGWPDTTVTATARKYLRVHESPQKGSDIGTIASGTRVTWKRIVAGAGECKAWLAIEPHGYVCANDLAPSARPPAVNPSTPLTPMILDRWADVKPAGADVFEDIAAIHAGTPSGHLDDHTYIFIPSKAKWQHVDDVHYVHTIHGWISSHDLWWTDPKVFVGIELAPTSVLDFGWMIARRPGGKIVVRDAPSPTANKVREIDRQVRVRIFDQKGKYTQIGDDEWVETFEVRRPEKKPRPAGIQRDEKWLDIDLDQQTLVAYEGDTPVFTTLVATGRIKWGTPVGIFRIDHKDALLRMRSPAGIGEDDAWDIRDVPWVMRFRKNFAIHAAYWHDGFGRRRSQGCVNLSTIDARRIYDWVTPESPTGWVSVDGNYDTGTPVRIRNSLYPNPRWHDRNGNPIDVMASKSAPAR